MPKVSEFYTYRAFLAHLLRLIEAKEQEKDQGIVRLVTRWLVTDQEEQEKWLKEATRQYREWIAEEQEHKRIREENTW